VKTTISGAICLFLGGCVNTICPPSTTANHAIDWPTLFATEGVKSAFGLSTLVIGLVVGAWFGSYTFYRQKEYELVKQRYLEGGVDVIAGAFASMSGLVAQNYARGLRMLQSFREHKADFPVSDLELGFLLFDSSNMQDVALFRLRLLLGSNLFEHVFQVAMSDFESASNVASVEIPQAIRRIVAKPDLVKVTPEEFSNKFAEHLRDKFDEATNKYSRAIHELNVLATILPEQKMTFKQVEQFRKHKEVKGVLERMRAAYPDLAANEKQ